MTIRNRIAAADQRLPSRMTAADTAALDRAVTGFGRAADHKVWLLFVGNCRYEPSGAAPGYRPDLADGILDVRIVDGSQPLARTRLVVAVLLGTLGRCRVYRTWQATSLRVASLGAGSVPLCLDGEATETKPELRIVKRPKRLLVYRPTAGE